jgi:hypothetical protein
LRLQPVPDETQGDNEVGNLLHKVIFTAYQPVLVNIPGRYRVLHATVAKYRKWITAINLVVFDDGIQPGGKSA